MDYIERPPIPISQPMDIYDARLTFKKTEQGSKVVSVVVRRIKKGRAIKKTFPFLEDINDNDQNYWTSHGGERISVYHRVGRLEYVNDRQRSLIPIALGQKLESLVWEVYKMFRKIDD